MKYALVGNNDGPLKLLKALKRNGIILPDFVGLQNIPNSSLLSDYESETIDLDFKKGFEEKDLIVYLKGHDIDILINCFCNFKFIELLEVYDCYNVHPSYLPWYRGRHPMHWALILGEHHHGITIHKMTKNYDQGSILWQEKVNIHKEMSVAELRESLMKVLEMNFPTFISSFKNELKTSSIKSNKSNQGSYLPRRYPKDNLLQEWGDSELIYRKIKALRSEVNPAYLQTKDLKCIHALDVSLIKNEVYKEEQNITPKIIEIYDDYIILQMPNGALFKIFTEKNIKDKLNENSIIL